MKLHASLTMVMNFQQKEEQKKNINYLMSTQSKLSISVVQQS